MTKYLFGFERALKSEFSNYGPDWDKAIPVEVVASTQAEAEAEAMRLSGEPPEGFSWRIQGVGISVWEGRNND